MKNRIVILLFLSSAFGFAQQSIQIPLLDSLKLATYQEYTDLAEALKEPDNVIKLTLRKKKFKEFPKELYKFKNNN